MRNEMPSGDRALWHAEYERSPWGEVRENYHAALIVRATYASNGVDPPDLLDLMYGSEEVEQTEDEMKATVSAYKRRAYGN